MAIAAYLASETVFKPNGQTNSGNDVVEGSEVLMGPNGGKPAGRKAQKPEKGFGKKLNLSKSVSSLRAKAMGEKKEKGESGLGRERAMSASNDE